MKSNIALIYTAFSDDNKTSSVFLKERGDADRFKFFSEKILKKSILLEENQISINNPFLYSIKIPNEDVYTIQTHFEKLKNPAINVKDFVRNMRPVEMGAYEVIIRNANVFCIVREKIMDSGVTPLNIDSISNINRSLGNIIDETLFDERNMLGRFLPLQLTNDDYKKLSKKLGISTREIT